jgi:hypothetical protein
MRTCLLVPVLLGGCSLYTGSGSPPDRTAYTLVADRTVAAEGNVVGIDADQHGALWIAYDDGPVLDCKTARHITLVHWDPVSRTRLASYAYDDSISAASGLALVRGELWLNFGTYVTCTPPTIRVIDPASGAMLQTMAGRDNSWDLTAAGDRAWIAVANADTGARGSITALAPATGGVVESFETKVDFGSARSGNNWFLQGVASRPGELWTAAVTPDGVSLEIYDDSGHEVGSADPRLVSARSLLLAFDRGELLIATGGQLSWFHITP